MSVLVVGLSHRTAPVAVLERAAVPVDDLRKTLDELNDTETISEVLLLSTCNRVEVYADVSRFHPAVTDITSVLARHAGIGVSDLADHLYVHFAEAAVQHIFSVASGLESMVVGESQILGQLRSAYALGTEVGSIGSVLHDLAQTALRVGKRIHTETDIDRAGASIVSVALDQAATVLGSLEGKRAVIVGAGSMGALAGATLRRRGVTDLVVANRTLDRAERLAATLEGRAVRLEDLPAEIAAADVLVSLTGATGLVVETSAVGPRATRPLAVLDLALPRDVDPAVGDEVGVTYIDLEALRADGATVSDAEVAAAAAIVASELSAFLAGQQQLAVAPTVTALRARANQVIEAEMARLDGRLPELSDEYLWSSASGPRLRVFGAYRQALPKRERALRMRPYASYAKKPASREE